MESQRTTVRDVPLRWEETGQGFPVVLIHGIPTAPALWRHVVPRIDGACCLAFEMVGYGHSIPAGRERDISVARQAAYLLGWLDALGVQRAILVGHDLGGGVAQIAAVRQPQRCAGLLLTNAISYDSWPIPTLAVADRLPDLGVPARIVWGAADGFQSIGYGERLAWDLDAPLERIEGGKHWVPEDHPDAIAAGIKDLLATVA